MLGVPSSATEKELSRAYKKLAKEHHPDANPGNAEAEERFKEVNAAYDVLGDAEKRKEYDEVRRMVASGVGPGRSGGGFGTGGTAGGQRCQFDVDFGDGRHRRLHRPARQLAGEPRRREAGRTRTGSAARPGPRDRVAPVVRRCRARRHEHRAVPRRRDVLDVQRLGRGARGPDRRRVRSVTAAVRSRSIRDRSRSRRCAPRVAGAVRSSRLRARRATAEVSRCGRAR